MDIIVPALSDVETPLLKDFVRDLSGRPSIRSNSGVEVAERFAYFGISSDLVTYLTGPLGQSISTAAANMNTWYGTAFLTPLLGAFVADSFLRRYRTIVTASLLYVLGLGFLSLSAALYSFNSSSCENDNQSCSVTQFQITFFFFSLYLIALVQGGHRHCLQAFGADQFDEEDKK